MDLTGKVVFIGNEFEKGKFKKVEVWLETDEKYPQTIGVEFHNDNTDFVSKLSMGEYVKILFNLRGKVWENPNGDNRCFNTLVGWKIEEVKAVEKEVVTDLPF